MIGRAVVMCATLASATTVFWAGSYSSPRISKLQAESAAANRLKQLCDRGTLQQACGYFVFVREQKYAGKRPVPNAWAVEYRNAESHMTVDFLVHPDGHIETAWNRKL